jgi:non-canonical (house-cleaning) NTP pyrophosphatase
MRGKFLEVVQPAGSKAAAEAARQKVNRAAARYFIGIGSGIK